MTTKIDVLDHGFVRLVSYMQPVPESYEGYASGDAPINPPPNWTGDLEIVRNARVSYNADWRGGDSIKEQDVGNKDTKLINYMMLNRHTSPFEAMVFTFEIKCPLFIARQWHRHRTWSYNEVSARYTELPEEFYVPKPEHIGKQSKSNKQARDLDGVTSGVAENHEYVLRTGMESAFAIYKVLLAQGCPRELARSVLPLATYTRFFGTVDLHNLFHFIALRDHDHAQFEIREYAKALKQLIAGIVPVSVEAFDSLTGRQRGSR